MKFILLMIFSASAWADISLDEAYIREKSFLVAQKEALMKMKVDLNHSFSVRKGRAEKDIEIKQSELTDIMLKNQELQEEYKVLDKMTKESSQMNGQLEKNALKIQESFGLMRSKLGLIQKTSTENDAVNRFQEILEEGLNLIGTVSSHQWKSHAFLDENEHLVQGEVLFDGIFGAWGRLNGRVFSLVPYNNEFLKISSEFSGNEEFLFSPNFEKTSFKTHKSWKETVADAIPGIVMMLIMVCVLGLFILLARA
ncbi:MAG: hypothetical protein AB7I27_08190 [Bacteriovoracaceae bacterium]